MTRINPPKIKWHVFLTFLFITVCAVAISLPGSFSSGSNWPDGQRYTFNGILIHDMIRDGGFFHPYQYAVDFYAHYPATNLPYGPPVFAVVFTLFFSIFGISFAVARGIVVLYTILAALTLWWLIYKNGKYNYQQATLTVCIFLFNPFTLTYAREISPELAVAFHSFLTIILFWNYIEHKKKYFGVLTAFALGCGYLCKPYIIPLGIALVLYAVLYKKWKIIFSKESLISTVVFLLLVVPATYLAFKFAVNETGPRTRPAMNFDWLVYYPVIAVQHFIFVTLFSLIGFAKGFHQRDKLIIFSSLWLISCYVFFTFYMIHHEIKYFYTFVPSLIIPCGLGLSTTLSSLKRFKLYKIGLGLLLCWCAYMTFNTPVFYLRGYEKAGQYVAQHIKGKSVLFYGRYDGNFMMGVRKVLPHNAPFVLRGDRQLAVRVSYGEAKESVTVSSAEEIIDLLNRYQTDYVVVEKGLVLEKDFPEYKLLLNVVGNKTLFNEEKVFPIETNWNTWAGSELVVYKFILDKDSDSSEIIKVIVPTLNQKIIIQMAD